MTDDELHAAIAADAEALALVQVGDDVAAAERMSAILPKVMVDTYANELSILSILGPDDGNSALSAVESAAVSNPLLARIVRILRTDRGLNIGDPVTQAMLDQLQTAGVLQAAWVTALKSHAMIPQAISQAQVSSAWARNRPDGKVGA